MNADRSSARDPETAGMLLGFVGVAFPWAMSAGNRTTRRHSTDAPEAQADYP